MVGCRLTDHATYGERIVDISTDGDQQALDSSPSLVSRFGVNSINNISMMRKRARVFLIMGGLS